MKRAMFTSPFGRGEEQRTVLTNGLFRCFFLGNGHRPWAMAAVSNHEGPAAAARCKSRRSNPKGTKGKSRWPAAAAGLSWFETTGIAHAGNAGFLTMRFRKVRVD